LQGITFRDVLEEVRYEVARQLLALAQLSIDEIAAARGYASGSPFVRPLKRWRFRVMTCGNVPRVAVTARRTRQGRR
jgi:AraC-like DNA-binding protein